MPLAFPSASVTLVTVMRILFAIHKRALCGGTLRGVLLPAALLGALAWPAVSQGTLPQDDGAPSAPATDFWAQGATPDAGSAETGIAPAEDRTARLDRLLAELADPEDPDWGRAQADLQREWSRSGSAAMDLLLQRGRDAMEKGEPGIAIEHLSALIDYAPDFAEGWNARATAYFMAGAFGQSLSDIQHVLALNPNHYGALAGLGMILQQLDRSDLAAEAWRASLKINPHQAQVREALDGLDAAAAGTRL